ncbi:uncharacterized protein LOC135480816 [Liolophura sinensis]|uniref:uncharacterized protein LOC135480816 n=1 Tax=Liolophura sinensis TaxID=3198878 RepID=UPI00315991D7
MSDYRGRYHTVFVAPPVMFDHGVSCHSVLGASPIMCDHGVSCHSVLGASPIMCDHGVSCHSVLGASLIMCDHGVSCHSVLGASSVMYDHGVSYHSVLGASPIMCDHGVSCHSVLATRCLTMPKRKSAAPKGRKSRSAKHSQTEPNVKIPEDVPSSSTENGVIVETVGKMDSTPHCCPSHVNTINSRQSNPKFPCKVYSQVASEAQGSSEETRTGFMIPDIPDTSSSNTNEENLKQKMAKSETVTPKQFTEAPASVAEITHVHVTKPDLIFTDAYTYKRRACITNNGTKIDINDMSLIGNFTSRTNGRFQTGRQYWEMKISVPLYSPRPVFFDISVTQEHSGGNWYLRVGYHRSKVKCSNYCFGKIEPGYGKWRPYTDPHHLGVFLNCEDRTLMVFEPAENQLVFTVGDIDVSEALLPVVRFGYVKCAYVELITGDRATLPQVLCEIMNATSDSCPC